MTLHEAAHGYVAWRLGDDTAHRAGRVSFNPAKHVDPIGTILLPALLFLTKAPFLFGWAKPVPVNFARLGHPRRDMVWVAAAGPAVNLALAFASALLLHVAAILPTGFDVWVKDNLFRSVLINVVLAVFNMLPLPPLDGGRMAVGVLPRRLALPLARLERWGLFIIVGALLILPTVGRQVGLDLDIFGWLMETPVELIIDAIALMAGLDV